jgi:hypothetical protein
LILAAAIAGSLALHATALFGPDIELFDRPEAPLPQLRAELQVLPPMPNALTAPPPVPAAEVIPKPAGKPEPKRLPKLAMAQAVPVLPDDVPPASEPDEAAAATSQVTETPSVTPTPVVAPVTLQAVLPASGYIRFAVFKTSLAIQVGRAEHRWEFHEDGTYRLTNLTETSGLAAVFKPVQVVQESRGRLAPGGLQPEHFSTRKNGRDSNENATFDWSTAEVRWSRDGSSQPLRPGTQDVLSLNYQLAYLGKLSNGVSLNVVTGRKAERHDLDSLGETEIEVPAGRFRTLHLRAQSDKVTEIWIALDRQALPVKIRFTDRKGETYEQLATEIGLQ